MANARLPTRETVLIGQITDKQGDVYKSGKIAFKLNGEMALIDYKEHLAPEELMEWAAEPLVRFGGQTLAPDMARVARIGLMDEGFLAKIMVRDFVASTEGFYHACKGRGGVQVKHTVYPSPTPHGGGIMIVYHFDDDDFQNQLYIERIQKLGEIKGGRSKTPRLWLPEDIDSDFVDELTAMRLIPIKPKYGFTRLKWDKVSTTRANDYGDVLKMGLVLWYIAGPEIIKAEEGKGEEELVIGR